MLDESRKRHWWSVPFDNNCNAFLTREATLFWQNFKTLAGPISFTRDVGEWGHSLLTFLKGANVADVPFHNSIMRDFMVYQDRLETNLLQLFAYTENSEWFSNFPFFFLSSTLLLNRNKHNWFRFFYYFLWVSIALNSFTASLPFCCSVIPVLHAIFSEIRNLLWQGNIKVERNIRKRGPFSTKVRRKLYSNSTDLLKTLSSVALMKLILFSRFINPHSMLYVAAKQVAVVDRMPTGREQRWGTELSVRCSVA